MLCYVQVTSLFYVCVLQCSVCVDGHLGTPVDGHQCYLQMDLDKDYYFEPLLKDRTLFFVILPKYLNVDIRIMIDVKIRGESCCSFAVFLTCFEKCSIS